LQSGEIIRVDGAGEVQPSQPVAVRGESFAARLLQGRVRVLDGGADDLPSVREVATKLGVSTATVYALCERGELVHVRVSNAIRIAPADLAAFVANQRRGGPRGS
jgi:excisionase family DNA binding protein